MYGFSQFLQISFSEAFERISAGATVITPNRRLALALKGKINQAQIHRKALAWHSFDVLPFTAFIERIYFDTLYSEQAPKFPLLLTVSQEQALWESIIQSSEAGKLLLRVSETARSVREAWHLAHAWQLSGEIEKYYPNDDGRAFLDWTNSYRSNTTRNGQTDQARICDVITERYAALSVKKPSAVICYGFNIFTPQQIAFLNKLIATGCEVVTTGTAFNRSQSLNIAQRVEYTSSDEEIYHAATWARTKIEADPTARIGIVVPALADYRNKLTRIFQAVMYPDIKFALPGGTLSVMPFNVSLGLPLTSYPLINAALLVLTLLYREVEFNRVSHWLRSPFLVGSETEMGQRAWLDARIRRNAEPFIDLDRLITLIQQANPYVSCPILLQGLSALAEFRQTRLPQSGSHAVLARSISEILQTIGFPGERNLDSTEYQVVKKWQALLAEFTTLDHVIAVTSYHQAVSRLNFMASETLFQPETPDVPIQILGVLEAAGMDFDHLWVMGLTDEQWPLRTRPNPFLPLELQRTAKLPFASTWESLAFCRQLTNGWLSGSKEVILSNPKFSDNDDRHELKPSALIKSIAQIRPVFPEIMGHGDLIRQTCDLQQLIDNQAPSLDSDEARLSIKGGTSVIKDYAACPFRAWAKHRLQIVSLEQPHSGLNAKERGSLTHQVLALLWRQLKTKEALDTITDDELGRTLKTITHGVVAQMQQYKPAALSGRLAQIEQRRLVQLIHEWLHEERKRENFAVTAIEEKRFIQIANLELSARLDRVDELDDGQHIVIDYKTSKQSIQAMIGERPDEPQLPLYLVMTEAEQQAAGAAFAFIKRGEMGFAAITQKADLLPGVKDFKQLNGCNQFGTWKQLLEAWRQNLTNLAAGFSSGEASVAPKHFPVTCNYCDLQLFCRIHERASKDSVVQDEEND